MLAATAYVAGDSGHQALGLNGDRLTTCLGWAARHRRRGSGCWWCSPPSQHRSAAAQALSKGFASARRSAFSSLPRLLRPGTADAIHNGGIPTASTLINDPFAKVIPG